MTDNATPVIIQPQTPSSPQTILVDALLLGVEYFLVKWLLKKWNEFESGQGPPEARCQKITEPPDFPTGSDSTFVWQLEQDYYNKVMSRAINSGASHATFHLRAVNTTNYPQWAGWNWHVEVYAKGASGDIGSTD